MFLNSMLKWKYGQAGSRKPEKPPQAKNRMIDSNRTVKKSMQAMKIIGDVRLPPLKL
jgi:hypothetical protein